MNPHATGQVFNSVSALRQAGSVAIASSATAVVSVLWEAGRVAGFCCGKGGIFNRGDEEGAGERGRGGSVIASQRLDLHLR